MIDGLKLTFSGEELRRLLDERVTSHRKAAGYWQRQQSRPPESETEDEPLLPEHMCTFEMAREEWRAEVLEFIRDHVDPHETYRLGAADLEFGELLPAKPGQLEQEEYEERTAVGFHLGRLAKNLGERPWKWVRDEEASLALGAQVDRLQVDEGSEPVGIDGPDRSQ